MLHEFLDANRKELIARCRAKVAQRPRPRATPDEMEHGIPLFLEQLIETLRLDNASDGESWRQRSTASGSAKRHVSAKIATTAAKHGHDLLRRGFTVDQVVRDYGDLCQAVTELAVEAKSPVSPDEFRTFNLCLDDAIADAVTEFGWQRDQSNLTAGNRALSERLGFLTHQMRNFLNTAILSFAAIKGGGVGLGGATAAVHETSLAGLRDLIDGALTDVRLAAGPLSRFDDVALDRFIANIQVAAKLEARAKGCEFEVSFIEPGVSVRIDEQMLYSAVWNLLHNAFKFSRSGCRVSLKAFGKGDRVLIEVEDECGGLGEGKAGAIIAALEKDHAGEGVPLGLGLSIARRAIEISGGKLCLRDLAGVGCVFAIDLPRHGA